MTLNATANQDTKAKRGRKVGDRATTKQEDTKILKEFHRLRPPGRYIDARILHTALPKKVKEKVGLRTVIRRLAEKNYFPIKKKGKTDPTEVTKKKRLVFAREHLDKNFQQWQAHLQAVADLKDRPSEFKIMFSDLLLFLLSVPRVLNNLDPNNIPSLSSPPHAKHISLFYVCDWALSDHVLHNNKPGASNLYLECKSSPPWGRVIQTQIRFRAIQDTEMNEQNSSPVVHTCF